MALHLSTSVRVLPGVGEETAKDLKALDILSLRDLLMHFPFRYDDYARIVPVAKLRNDETATIVGTIRQIETRPSKKNPRLKLTEAIFEDESGTLKVMWFNQPYLEKTLKPGTKVSLAGRLETKMGRSMVNPVHEPAGAGVHTGRLVPIYPLTGDLTARRLRTAMKAALAAASEFLEWLPESVSEGMPTRADAIRAIHFPDSREELDAAVHRLKFDELFLHQLQFAEVRRERAVKTARQVPVDEEFLKTFVASLPFQLTPGQRRSAWEVVQDLAIGNPMNRLLQGDVGSGKTAVAAVAAAATLKQGFAVAYLAPTELLARQQAATFGRYLKGHPVCLITAGGSEENGEPCKRAEALARVASGAVQCVVGTHALLSEGVVVPDLALVIVDEQHRFGVSQRHALLETGDRPAPHLLSMTATPIPRSLALTLYGDLEVSIIPDRPKGRIPIATYLVAHDRRDDVWAKVREEAKQGRRTYVVCPLIEDSETSKSTSAESMAKELARGPLKGLRVGLLHGRMKQDEKTQALDAFRTGDLDVLVATTVVEVGVDVPEATVIAILGAERFGLAQLHQLRGRVGRGKDASYCFLLPDALTAPAKARLEALTTSDDGFELAELDLKLRGAGNLFGNAQSGFPDFVLATLADVDIMKTARDRAVTLLKGDPMLDDHPVVKQMVKDSFDRVHLE